MAGCAWFLRCRVGSSSRLGFSNEDDDVLFTRLHADGLLKPVAALFFLGSVLSNKLWAWAKVESSCPDVRVGPCLTLMKAGVVPPILGVVYSWNLGWARGGILVEWLSFGLRVWESGFGGILGSKLLGVLVEYLNYWGLFLGD
ncbi:hypothetical protein U1Q18_003378 [Sarracenia purpurea var. burkii]